MEGLLIAVFLLFVIGGMSLVLGLGIMSKEAEKEHANHQANRFETGSGSHFFNRIASDVSRRAAEPVDESFVLDVEKYLEREQAMADQFVSEPSVENLYRHIYEVAG